MIPSLRPSTILFVEDDVLVREIATETMREAGYEVVALPDGEAAMQALATVQPDLILSDVRMPRCTGFELLQRVRSDPTYKPTPFIFMSAKADTADQRHGMSLGADDYVTKPYLPEDLLKTIEVRLARSSMFNEAIRRQQQFLSRVLPHELRTPLTGVMGYADLMIEIGRAGESLSAEELVEYGTNLQSSAQRLQRVAEDFSLWSWLEAQFEALRNRKTAALVESTVVWAELAPSIDVIVEQLGRKRDLSHEVQSAIVTVPAEGLVRVVQHLVENALKFSLPASPVRVTGTRLVDRYEIAIRDEGRGMSEEEVEWVGMLCQFRREQYEQQGLGVGLALARNFARLAGGDFIISRNHPDPGVTVRLVLPLAEPLRSN